MYSIFINGSKILGMFQILYLYIRNAIDDDSIYDIIKEINII